MQAFVELFKSIILLLKINEVRFLMFLPNLRALRHFNYKLMKVEYTETRQSGEATHAYGSCMSTSHPKAGEDKGV